MAIDIEQDIHVRLWFMITGSLHKKVNTCFDRTSILVHTITHAHSCQQACSYTPYRMHTHTMPMQFSSSCHGFLEFAFLWLGVLCLYNPVYICASGRLYPKPIRTLASKCLKTQALCARFVFHGRKFKHSGGSFWLLIYKLIHTQQNIQIEHKLDWLIQ